MNDNNIKTHIYYKIKVDLTGHQRSHEVILIFENIFSPLKFDLETFRRLGFLSIEEISMSQLFTSVKELTLIMN